MIGLQYGKEKQQEQRLKRYNNRNYNNNNNNNDDDKKNDDDIKKNDDDIVPGETIGVVIGEEPRNERMQHVLALIEGDGSPFDPDITEEEWYDDGEIVGALTDHDIRKEINNELTIADIQNGIEKRKQHSRDAELKKQQENKSAEATGN